MNQTSIKPSDKIFNRQFVLMSVSNLVSNSVFGIFLIFPLLILQMGGNKADIGILMGAMPLSAVVSRPLASSLVDRFGRKICYNIGCLILGAVSFLHIYFQQNMDSIFYMLLVLRLLFGFGWSLCLVGAFTIITDIIPKSRFAQGIGIFTITFILGIAFGPMLGEWLVRVFDFSAMFIAAVFLSVAAVMLTIWIEDRFVYRASQETTTFMRILRFAPLLRGCLIAVCIGFSLAAHSSFVAPYAHQKGLIISSYFSAYAVMAIFSRIIGGPLANRFGESKIIPLALLVTGAGFASLTMADTAVSLILSGMIIGLGHGTTTPNVMATAMRPISAQNRGRANGVFTGSLDTGLFVGSFALGWIGEVISFQVLFLVAGAGLLVGFLISIFWRIDYAD